MLLNNRYQIIRTLESGGFGDTFLAEDTQMPSQRRCVIKQLKPIVDNPQIYQLVQERFVREAAILEELGSLSSQIPTLYAYFHLADKFYLVQEWIEGDTLTNAVQQQGLFSETRVKEILSSILPVLDFVHSKRIVHRDIKPDNIILRRSDNQPVLIDFGAVREAMGTVVNSQGSLTRSIVIGTPGYMPSEQAAGRAVYSSDLYSLGLTIIYLLTEKSPQQLETDVNSGEILWESDTVNISASLKTVINQVIAFHPRERYTTASQMLQALQNAAIPFSRTVTFQPQATTQPSVVSNQSTKNLSLQNNQHQPSKQLGILSQSIVIGSVIGMFTLGGLWLLIPRNVTPQTEIKASISEPEATATSEPEPTTTPESTATSEPEPTTTPDTNNIVSESQPTTAPTPVNTIKRKRGQPYLGIQMVTLTADIKEKLNSELGSSTILEDKGVLLIRITPDSPASQGGLKAGDVIVSINQQRVSNNEDVQKIVDNSKIGQQLDIEVKRNGRTISLAVRPVPYLSEGATIPAKT